MAYLRQAALPVAEPLTVPQVKTFLSLPSSVTAFDAMLAMFISAAREDGERETGRVLAQRKYEQVLDAFPSYYYDDGSGVATSFTGGGYGYPQYGTAGPWGAGQAIELGSGPVLNVQGISYIDPNGDAQTLLQDTDFVLDRITEPARIFPVTGLYWPATALVEDAVVINFTTGYDPNPSAVDTHTIVVTHPGQQPISKLVTGISNNLLQTMLNHVAFNFNNRGCGMPMPAGILQGFRNNAIVDFAPTRG